MAINFPPGPHQTGDTYTEDGLTWEWSGVKWVPVGGGGGGDQFWQQNGDNIFYDAGSVGVGVDAPQTALHIQTDAASEIRLEGADGSSARLRLNSGTDNADSVFVSTGSFGVTGQPNTNLALGTNAVDGAIMFTQAGAELGRVDPDGRLLLGQNDLTGIDGEADRIVAASNAGHSGITVRSASDRQGALYFADQDAGNVGRIEYNHQENWMRFHTNGVERFRYSADGALGVAGPNFGDAGQVLTSQGDAAAPQWAAPAVAAVDRQAVGMGGGGNTRDVVSTLTGDITKVEVGYILVNCAGPFIPSLQFGDGALDGGNNYRFAAYNQNGSDQNVGASATTVELSPNDNALSGGSIDGLVIGTRVQNGQWLFNWQLSVTNNAGRPGSQGNGVWLAAADTAARRVRLWTNSTWSGGTCFVNFYS